MDDMLKMALGLYAIGSIGEKDDEIKRLRAENEQLRRQVDGVGYSSVSVAANSSPQRIADQRKLPTVNCPSSSSQRSARAQRARPPAGYYWDENGKLAKLGKPKILHLRRQKLPPSIQRKLIGD